MGGSLRRQKRSRKDPAAVRLAARRSAKIPAARRREIARQAALARWAGRNSADKRAMAPIEQIAAELTRDIPQKHWDRLPTDLVDRLEHYLYSWPRR